MVLFSAAGFAVDRFLGVRLAFPIGVIAGFIVANLVPAKTACSSSEPKPPV